MVKKSFFKTGISNDLDGSEDHYLWNECEEEDVDEYIPPSCYTLNDVPRAGLSNGQTGQLPWAPALFSTINY